MVHQLLSQDKNHENHTLLKLLEGRGKDITLSLFWKYTHNGIAIMMHIQSLNELTKLYKICMY
jgi:hypothetical protein